MDYIVIILRAFEQFKQKLKEKKKIKEKNKLPDLRNIQLKILEKVLSIFAYFSFNFS